MHRIFNLWPTLFNQLPDDVILRIFSFIPFHLIRRTISLSYKKWNRISEDPSLVGLDQESSQTYSALLEQRLKAVLKRFLMIPNLLETLLFKRLLLTFSPLINERLT